jgi:hypothetical protein
LGDPGRNKRGLLVALRDGGAGRRLGDGPRRLHLDVLRTVISNPRSRRIANQQLGYPLYIIPLIGVTHILGGVGLLIPNVPRLTQWVYAGLAITLLLAFYSQLNGGGSTWDKFDPILVMAFVFASYVLRRYMRANRWSI